MERQTINIKLLIGAFFLALLIQSCYYDSEEYVYPQASPCDTVDITYTTNVWPVINDNCTSCHSGGAPSGNVSLSDYDEIVTAANNGSLLGTIRHEDGWSPMPKGGAKLSDCNIKWIEIWVADGTPNN